MHILSHFNAWDGTVSRHAGEGSYVVKRVNLVSISDTVGRDDVTESSVE